MDAESDDGRSPGTFRWPKNAALPALPAQSQAALPSVVARGWGPYLKSRGGDALVTLAQTNAMLLDGLSFPLTLAWLLGDARAATFSRDGDGKGVINIIVLGATTKAEVRVFLETNYFVELERQFEGKCRLNLEFVGPEIEKGHANSSIHHLSPPCAQRFFAKRRELTPENTLCVIFNGGFGNFVDSGRDELLWSWIPDLAFLGELGYLCVFTCANDYADLRGEVAVHTALLGSKFVVAPRKNPFSMATVYSGDANAMASGAGGKQEWFSGNSYLYVTCGCASNSRDTKAAASLPRLRDSSSGDTGSGLEKAQKSARAAIMERAALGLESMSVCAADAPVLKPVVTGSNATTKADVQASASHPPSSTASASPARDAAAMARATLENARDHPSVPSDAKSANAQAGTFEPNVSVRIVEDGSARLARMDISLPDVQSMDEVDLQLSATMVSLTISGGMSLQRAWPEQVDDSCATASFSSKKRQLVVKAPII
eukprot:TRINITY_DN22601_c0_g1_i1.p1 TRINITY_DN22601_c0_g1~~TRINITY_DN22601_c0_g1_i1.p1  ORF type:complete len:489 (-),score=57.02 TRINITY_DN22601_c0_g1_i1:60-1526(-)